MLRHCKRRRVSSEIEGDKCIHVLRVRAREGVTSRLYTEYEWVYGMDMIRFFVCLSTAML